MSVTKLGKQNRWTIPLFASALKSITFIGWYSGWRLRSSLCSRNSSRVNSSSFSWIAEKQTLILTFRGIPFVTQRKDVKLSAGGVAIPGSLLVHWRTTTGFEGLPLQNLDLISSTFSTSKSFVVGSAVANTCCWNSTEPTLTPFGGSELKFVEYEATPSTAVSSCSSTATSVVLGGVFSESSALSWTSTASVVPVSVSSDETSLLSPREARVSSLNWSDSSLEKRGLSSAGDPRSGVSGTKVSKAAPWSTRVALSSTAPEDVVGFGSKNVKVVTVWEVLVMAGASLHLDLCRVRSKLRVTCVPQNSHSKIPFWRSETKDSLCRGIKRKALRILQSSTWCQ